MNDLLRIDIVSVLDLRFASFLRDHHASIAASHAHDTTRILERLHESLSWLFYDEQLNGFELFDVSWAVPSAAGAALRINPRMGIGTYIIWRTYQGGTNPLILKNKAWGKTNDDLGAVDRFFRNLRVERFYPFVAFEVDTNNIDDFAAANAEELGRILTGDFEGERPTALRKYVDNDLSLRSYEKLFIRWTEALAIYSHVESDTKYELCMFRAVQVFENCIMARVSLQALSDQMRQLERRLLVVTPVTWLRGRDLLTSFANTEEMFVMYPRVQSVEADKLITDAHQQFGIDKVLAGAKLIQTEFREQLEWAKAQTLGLFAVITYLIDKIIGWDAIRKWLILAFYHMLDRR